jgi:DNA-binding response OmpR family regulator
VRLLVVEDEERIASFLIKGLRAHGYEVEWTDRGKDALARGVDPGLSLVILDLGLPDLGGLEVLETLRGLGTTVPVLVLSARGQVDDRVRGLELGADDYLAKPFAFDELLARVRARLRPSRDHPQTVQHFGDIEIDLFNRTVMVDGREVTLSGREFSLLQAFVHHPHEVLSRQQLLSMVWGMDFDPRTNLVDVYVGYLRRKLGEKRIETVRRAGYRFASVASPVRGAVPGVGFEPTRPFRDKRF